MERESPDKYTGYELNDNIEELYELMKRIAEDKRLLRTIKAFYRVNKTLRDIIGAEVITSGKSRSSSTKSLRPSIETRKPSG